ncbi:DNA cytosine methyltransferase [Mycolicibacterium fortuitum]|uniref:DNA cytosine methyltransferase n=1 Tax=Mycolicibacterium fortuitum TaxID=1766 RepID=UPI0026308109|nr:DNA (cytosine-5-)-methyltransferase [Mycolicibacterium fortuitum]
MPDMPDSAASSYTALEFFAGIGLARMGLEDARIDVAWANDIEIDKKLMYEGHFGTSEDDHTFALGDLSDVHPDQMPATADIAWASSPCTDLSLAGDRAGLRGKESGAFWQFTRVLDEYGEEKRPKVAVLENVVGLATSHGGEDLAAAITEFNRLGYSADVLMIDARRFLPQSRPRLFVIGAQNPPKRQQAQSELRPDSLMHVFGNTSLRTHRAVLPAPPAPVTSGLGVYIENIHGNDGRWWDSERTAAFLNSLSPRQAARVNELRNAKTPSYRTAYRRTRNGIAVWEVRPDDVSGCLRTARGGSSKQAVVKLGDGKARVRWMTPREYARLMGAGDYNLSGARNNQALFGFGDAVAVPVVSWLAKNYLVPLLDGTLDETAEAEVLEAASGE